MNVSSYLTDIFEHLNSLNLKLQGKKTNLIYFRDNLKVFVEKTKNWCGKVNCGNVSMFNRLCSLIDKERNKLNSELKSGIVAHLNALDQQFERYFSN